MPFASDLPNNKFEAYEAEMVMVSDAASTKSIEGLCKRLDNAKLY
jgi:hypothetical protein